MLIPSSLYGRYEEVKRRGQKMLTRLRRQASFDEAVGAQDLLDTATVPGLLVIHGPSPLIGGQEHFQCFVPHLLIRRALFDNRLTLEITEHVFEASLESPWGLLGLLSQPNQGWLYPRARLRPTLKAALKFWDVFAAEGARYSTGLPWGTDLWSANSNLAIVLAELGVPQEVLQKPLPPENLSSLLSYIRDGRA